VCRRVGVRVPAAVPDREDDLPSGGDHDVVGRHVAAAAEAGTPVAVVAGVERAVRAQACGDRGGVGAVAEDVLRADEHDLAVALDGERGGAVVTGAEVDVPDAGRRPGRVQGAVAGPQGDGQRDVVARGRLPGVAGAAGEDDPPPGVVDHDVVGAQPARRGRRAVDRAAHEDRADAVARERRVQPALRGVTGDERVLDAVDRGASGDDDAAVGLARDALELGARRARHGMGQQAVARPARVEPSVAREGGDEGPAHPALDDRSGDERPVVRDVAVAAVS
jgi:hypothetical protein